MLRAKTATLVGLIDLEDDLDISAVEGPTDAKPMPPAKRPRAAAAGRAAKSTQAKSASARTALTEKTSNVPDKTVQGKGIKRPASEDISEVQDSTETARAGRGRPRVNKAPRIAETEDELSEIQIETTAPPRAKRGRKPKASTETEIPETQQPETDVLEIPETQPDDRMDASIGQEEPVKMPPKMNMQPIPSPRRQQSRLLSSPIRKLVSASDSEQSDPTLRRRIGELTRKYESLEAKYRDLREIGVQEAERNFDRLQKQSEERANSKFCFP